MNYYSLKQNETEKSSVVYAVGLIDSRGSLLTLKRIKVNQGQEQEEEEVLQCIDTMLPCQGNLFSQNLLLCSLFLWKHWASLWLCVEEREFLLRVVRLQKKAVMLREEQQLLWLQLWNLRNQTMEEVTVLVASWRVRTSAVLNALVSNLKPTKRLVGKKKQRIFKGTWRWSLLTVVYVLCVAGHHSWGRRWWISGGAYWKSCFSSWFLKRFFFWRLVKVFWWKHPPCYWSQPLTQRLSEVQFSFFNIGLLQLCIFILCSLMGFSWYNMYSAFRITLLS